MEAVYHDYRDKVEFRYIYKTVEHPGINGFVEPFTLEERLKHIAIAKERIRTEIPWLCDSMENDLKKFFGKSPNGEFILNDKGQIVRKRFWSSAKTLREDLEELVGKADTLTMPEDIGAGFRVETIPDTKIASGIVTEIDLPTGLKPLRIEPMESSLPFYAKLRVEATPRIRRVGGKLHFLLTLDPIYKMHWNNLAGKVRIEISPDEELKFSEEAFESEPVDAKADIDPRRFLVDLRCTKLRSKKSFVAKVIYHVCDDAETVCMSIEQRYRISFKYNRDGGTRPGIFMVQMLQDIWGWDKNEDGVITRDELPRGNEQLIMNHIDYSGNGIIEKDEVARFKDMFNNGKGVGRPDGSSDDESEPEPSSDGETADSTSEENAESEDKEKADDDANAEDKN